MAMVNIDKLWAERIKGLSDPHRWDDVITQWEGIGQTTFSQLQSQFECSTKNFALIFGVTEGTMRRWKRDESVPISAYLMLNLLAFVYYYDPEFLAKWTYVNFDISLP